MCNKQNCNSENNSTAINNQVTPEQLISDILLSDEPLNLRQHLTDMAFAYMLDEDERKCKMDVFATYKVLDTFLSKVEKIARNG